MVTWWVGRGVDHEVFRRVFGSQHPDVRFEYLGDDSLERTLAALLDGTAPDIVMVPRAGTVARLARQGYLADLSNCSWTQQVLPLARSVGTHDARLYAVPRSLETMLLFFDQQLFAEHGWRPPRTLSELEVLAAAMQAVDIVPFGVGTADVPSSVELYFSLLVNHHAGPAAVREVLLGRASWTSLAASIELLVDWFHRGWFGSRFFDDEVLEGFGRIATGEAGMSPNMTWVFGELGDVLGDRSSEVGVAPFPSADGAARFLVGTASLLAVSSASADPVAAGEVLGRLFTAEVRRDFSRALPGDWNLPLVDADVAGLSAATTPQFASAAVALTEAAANGRHGYASWTFFAPLTEEAVIAEFRDVVEGRLSARRYLEDLDAAFAEDRANDDLVEIE